MLSCVLSSSNAITNAATRNEKSNLEAEKEQLQACLLAHEKKLEELHRESAAMQAILQERDKEIQRLKLGSRSSSY